MGAWEHGNSGALSGFHLLWQVGDVTISLIFASRNCPSTYCIVFLRFFHVVKWNTQRITLNHEMETEHSDVTRITSHRELIELILRPCVPEFNIRTALIGRLARYIGHLSADKALRKQITLMLLANVTSRSHTATICPRIQYTYSTHRPSGEVHGTS